MSFRVAILARSPELGQVKTRLARQMGPEKALKLHKAMLELMCFRLNKWAPGAATLWVDDRPDHPFIADLAGRFGLPVRVQCTGNLGARIAFALKSELADTDAALVVGADCVGLTQGDLQEASQALSSGSDLAVGPASDGGYYLLGLGRPLPALFANVNWGTESVFRQTMDKASALGLRVARLTTRPDIDRLEDLEELDQKTLDLLGLGSWLSCRREQS